MFGVWTKEFKEVLAQGLVFLLIQEISPFELGSWCVESKEAW